ncbi:MAG: DUF456 domain-containing protein [Cyanobacteria bacterium P01_H01_bin.119]
MSLIVLYWILLVVMAVGVVGACVPGLPGASLILIGTLVWGLAAGFAGVGWALGTVIVVLGLSFVIDYLAAYLGAKRVGASTWGQVGAIAGMILGFLGLLPALPVGGPLAGILLGAIAGGFLGEFLYRRDLDAGPRTVLALKVSLAIVVGTLIGNILEGLLALVAVAVFVLTTWSTVMAG